MKLNLRQSVVLALISTFCAQVSYAERFNHIIDDFDVYLQAENDAKKIKQSPAEVPLDIHAPTQSDDVLTTLSPIPMNKEKAKRPSRPVVSQKTKTESVQTKQAQPKKITSQRASEVCSLPSGSRYSNEPILLSFYPHLFQRHQWSPKYLAKDFAKYQVILGPLDWFISSFRSQTDRGNRAYRAQLTELIKQQSPHLYQFGIAQGVGKLISYHYFLMGSPYESLWGNDNQRIIELTQRITDMQTVIDKLNEEIVSNKNQITQRQGEGKSLTNKKTVDEFAKIQTEMAEKQMHLTALSQENTQSKSTIKRLEKQISDDVAAFAETKRQLAEKDKSLNDAKQQIAQLMIEIAKLQSEVQQQSSVSGDADERLKVVNANLLEQELLLKQKEADLLGIQKELAVAKKNQDTLTKQLTESQHQEKQLQAKLVENERNYSETQLRLAQSNAQLQQLRQDLEKQTTLVEQSQDKQIKDLTLNLNRQMDLLAQREAELTRLSADKKSLQDALNAQLSDKKSLESENKLLTVQAKTDEKRMTQLEADIASRNKLRVDIEQQLLDAHKQINVLKQEAKKFTDETAEQQKQAQDKLKKQLDEKTVAETNAQQELTKVKENLRKAEMELSTLKSFATEDGLKSQIRNLNQKITALQDENEQLKLSQKRAAGQSLNLLQKPTQAIAQENEKRNKKIRQDITQQKYSRLDNHTYYKVLQKGTPISGVKQKNIKFIMREQLTDGKVTVMYSEKNPMVLPYHQLPPPLNLFVEKVGIGGMVKIYVEPEGGYGREGIPGSIPPNSMSIIDFKVIGIE